MNGAGAVPSVALQPFDISALSQMLVGLLVILALIWVVTLLIRRFGASRFSVSGPLKIVAGLPLGPRERVVLLQVDDVKVLVGVTPGGIETLYVQGQPTAQARVAGVTGNFDEQLATAVKRVEMP